MGSFGRTVGKVIIEFTFSKEGTFGVKGGATGSYTETMGIKWDCSEKTMTCNHLSYGALVWHFKS